MQSERASLAGASCRCSLRVLRASDLRKRSDDKVAPRVPNHGPTSHSVLERPHSADEFQSTSHDRVDTECRRRAPTADEALLLPSRWLAPSKRQRVLKQGRGVTLVKCRFRRFPQESEDQDTQSPHALRK